MYTFITAEPDYFAAASSSSAKGSKVNNAADFENIPLWVFHGDNDGTINISGNQALFLRVQAIGGNMKFTTWFGGGHGTSEQGVISGSAYEHMAWNKDTFAFEYEYTNSGVLKEWLNKVEYCSDLCDPEPNFMKWLFSKTRAPAASYASWELKHWLQKGPDGDDDGDGLPNRVEFAFGGDPVDSTDAGEVPSVTPASGETGGFECSFMQRTSAESGIVYRLEMTSELGSGLWSPAGETEIASVPINDEFNRVTHRIGGVGETPLFMRVQLQDSE